MTWKMRAVTPRVAGKLLREAMRAWWRDEGPHMGAALAFYAMLSFAPLLILMLAALSVVFGQEAAQVQVVGQVRQLIGKEGADAVKVMVATATRSSQHATVSMWLGIFFLFVGSVATFAELQDMMNRIWRVER